MKLNTKRADFREVMLPERLRDALWRLNPKLPDNAREEAFRKPTLTLLPVLSVCIRLDD